MHQQLVTMLDMQDAMNAKVNADWRDRNHEWYRAIWVECAELMDHFGWKWWKQQSPDRDQVVLELVDIWHFGLSDLLMSGRSYEEIAESLAADMDFSDRDLDFRNDVEAFACDTLKTKSFHVKGFITMMMGMSLSFDELYSRYVGKNVLNFFRQDNGYKEGSYIKVWSGKEDNEHLVELVEALDPRQQDFREQIYAGLSERYPSSVSE